MAHLPNPDDDPLPVTELITTRINRDPHTLAHFDTANDVVDVLQDLEADGHAKHLKGGWKNTPDGFEVLTGPPAENVPANAQPRSGSTPSGLNGGD
jgi:hypothetical protein